MERTLASEDVIVAAPMSLAGSTQRIWRMTRATMWLAPVAVLVLPFAWVAVLCWYVLFGVLLVPYRLLRRGARKRKRDALQHRERLEAGSH